MTHQIKVLNKNNFEITDYYDGFCHTFSPKVGVNIDLETAKHIFGVDFPADAEACKDESLRDTIFRHLQKRWGWNSSKADVLDTARRRFDKIEFTPVMFKQVELVVDDEPQEPREKKEFKNSKFKPRADEEPVEEVVVEEKEEAV